MAASSLWGVARASTVTLETPLKRVRSPYALFVQYGRRANIQLSAAVEGSAHGPFVANERNQCDPAGKQRD
jgi:hypothetical protein